MKEVFESILQSAKDRVTNPILGAFVISWLIFNWDAIACFLYSTEDIEYRISCAKEYTNLTKLLCYPLTSAIVLNVGFPFISYGLEKLLSTNKVRRKSLVIEEQISLLDVELRRESKKSEIEKIKLEKSQFEEERLSNENEKLLEEKDAEIQILKDKLSEETSDYYLAQSTLDYEEFKKSDVFKYFKLLGLSITQRKSYGNEINEIVIEKFKALDIIQEDPEGEMLFTINGMKLWKQFVLAENIPEENKGDTKESDGLPF